MERLTQLIDTYRHKKCINSYHGTVVSFIFVCVDCHRLA